MTLNLVWYCDFQFAVIGGVEDCTFIIITHRALVPVRDPSMD